MLTVVCGLAYPLLVTGAGQLVFGAQANGSLVELDGRVAGSELIGQAFPVDGFFLSRPVGRRRRLRREASSASNLGPSSPSCSHAVERRAAAYRERETAPAPAPVPADAVTASGSGLDPAISVRERATSRHRASPASEASAARARSRGWSTPTRRAPTLGFLGERGVERAQLNLALGAGS